MRQSLIWYSDIEHYPRKSDRFLVRTAFLEIYNEKISDLMVGDLTKKLKQKGHNCGLKPSGWSTTGS